MLIEHGHRPVDAAHYTTQDDKNCSSERDIPLSYPVLAPTVRRRRSAMQLQAFSLSDLD